MASDIYTRREASYPCATTRALDADTFTAAQVRRAQLSVARGALDAADCAELLDMLGLLSPAVLTVGGES